MKILKQNDKQLIFSEEIEESLAKVTNYSTIKLVFLINSEAEYVAISNDQEEQKKPDYFKDTENPVFLDDFALGQKYTFGNYR